MTGDVCKLQGKFAIETPWETQSETLLINETVETINPSESI